MLFRSSVDVDRTLLNGHRCDLVKLAGHLTQGPGSGDSFGRAALVASRIDQQQLLRFSRVLLDNLAVATVHDLDRKSVV